MGEEFSMRSATKEERQAVADYIDSISVDTGLNFWELPEQVDLRKMKEIEKMRVTAIEPNMLILEYRQDEEDKDYGSCLWARFYFNLDRYELTITSDCGNYGYKWYETPKSESFLELMARVEKGYMLEKLYGSANIFDYEATKELIYEMEVDREDEDDENKAKLDEIFSEIEFDGQPESGEMFVTKFEEANNYCDGWFTEIWEYCEFDYPSNALKIVDVFDECIQPKIIKILEEKNDKG